MTPNRSLWQALSASVLIHAALLAGAPDPSPLRWTVVGRRIDAQLVVRSAVRPVAGQVATNVVEAPAAEAMAPVPDERQRAVGADRDRRRAHKTLSAAVSARSLAARSPAASAASLPARPAASLQENPTVDNASPAAPDAVSAEELRQYRVDLAVAARRFKAHPEPAGARGREGTVEVALEAGARTPVPRVFLLRSSGYPAFDVQAVDMLSRAARATPLPVGLRTRDLRLVVAVRFDAQDGP